MSHSRTVACRWDLVPRHPQDGGSHGKHGCWRAVQLVRHGLIGRGGKGWACPGSRRGTCVGLYSWLHSSLLASFLPVLSLAQWCLLSPPDQRLVQIPRLRGCGHPRYLAHARGLGDRVHRNLNWGGIIGHDNWGGNGSFHMTSFLTLDSSLLASSSRFIPRHGNIRELWERALVCTVDS